MLSHSVVSDSATLRTVARQAPLSMGFSRQEQWSGLPCLPPGIFPTQRSNLGLPHCRWIPYHLSHQGSPGILEWVACTFPRGSSRPRNRTRVCCIAGSFFTSWAAREYVNATLPICPTFSTPLPHCVHRSTLGFQLQLINSVLTSSCLILYSVCHSLHWQGAPNHFPCDTDWFQSLLLKCTLTIFDIPHFLF